MVMEVEDPVERSEGNERSETGGSHVRIVSPRPHSLLPIQLAHVIMSDMRDTQSVDRSALHFVSVDEPDDLVEYWRSRTYEERLEGIQNLRQTFYGPAASERLCRVLEFAQQA